MLRNSEFIDFSNTLSEGFFADKVVSTLGKEGPLDSAGKEVLLRVQGLFGKIDKGKAQVGSAKLSSDAVDTIGAYQRAIIALRQALAQKHEQITEAKLKEAIHAMTDEIAHALKNEYVTNEKVTLTLSFFRFVQRETLKEGSRFFSGRAVLRWSK